MVHEASGVIVAICEYKSGVAKSGNKWERQNVHVSVPNEKFKQMISIQCGSKIIPTLKDFAVGDTVVTRFTVESKAGDQNDYTDCRCVDIKKV